MKNLFILLFVVFASCKKQETEKTVCYTCIEQQKWSSSAGIGYKYDTLTTCNRDTMNKWEANDKDSTWTIYNIKVTTTCHEN